MIQVTFIKNPMDPQNSAERCAGPDGISVRQWLRDYFGPTFKEFDRPTVCQINGEAVLRKDWDNPLNPGDQVVFVTIPQGVVSLVLAIVSIAIAVFIGAKLLLGDPKIPGETQSPDSVYTLRGQNNRFRPGEVIEVVYGRCRIWPTYLSRPYSRYKGNQQFQYSLFCLGQGDFDIINTYIDDTNTNRFDELELEFCPPGTPVTLVEGAVYTSLEVSNIELLGPNEDDYPGFSGPFTLNDEETPIRRVEADISFPSGLYELNDEGNMRSESCGILIQYRNMDGGSWEDLVNTTITRTTNTPQRITYSQGGLTAGQYEMRARRTTAKPESSQSVSQVRWEAAKGYARINKNFGDVYCIAMKARATNQLNDNSARAFNVRATRKLPTWTPEGGWAAATATRNPIWAFCDVLRSTYGAKLEDEYIDLPTLKALADTLSSRGDTFDWIFDQPLTIWEAAKTILRVGRCTPIPQGSLITAVRDESDSTVVGVFNQHNILKGSMTKSLSMFEFQPFDGTEIEYVEYPSWKPKTVECVLPGRSGTNLEQLKLPGCTDRTKALREGLYIQSRKELQRTTVTFKTGMEGFIPVFMDLIAVTHDTVRVGQGGVILDYDSDNKEFTLSEQPEFGSDQLTYVIGLRAADGTLQETLACTPGSAANKVEVAEHPDPLPDFTENQVPPLYIFGVEDLETFLGKVVQVRPTDFKTVEITCVNYVGDSYTNDTIEADPPDDTTVIQNPGDPEVAEVTISGILENGQFVNVSWTLAEGAANYILQIRYISDEEPDPEYTDVGTYATSPVQLAVEVGTIQVRVGPYTASGNVIWTESEEYLVGSSVTPPVAPGDTTQPDFVGLEIEAHWIPTGDANGYLVEVWPDGAMEALTSINVGSANLVVYTRAEFEVDSPGEDFRDFELLVYGYNDGGLGDPLMIARNNPIPAAPTALAEGSPTGDDYPVSWEWEDTEDLLEFNVYASTTPGFTPGPGNLVETVTEKASTITATVTTYWVVGVVDVWGDEETLSAEAEITI